ncbi:MAG TPA: DNA translocase FtsK 4TM domain-containing protein, partial [Chitinophagales bacterium]|nr:DNA translocase FtsK 4TM domain-containing protein [Chitinophagales bacterium]
MAKGELKSELEIVQEDSPEMEIEMSVNEKPKRKRQTRKKKESNDLTNELDEPSLTNGSKRNVVRRVVDFVRDERTHKIFGLVLVLFSVYTAVAIGSYFFTWQTDQDKVKQASWGLLFDNSISVNNALGRLGAFVSHNLIYNSFGVVSAIWILFTVAAGITLMLKRRVFNLAGILKASLLTSVICSTALAFIFQASAFPWGGAFGGMTAVYFLKMLGQVGTAGLLIASVLGLGIWMFNFDFNKLIPTSRPKMMEDDLDFAGGLTAAAAPQTFGTNASADIVEPKPKPFEPQQSSMLENIVSVFNPSPTPPVVEEDGFETVARQVKQRKEEASEEGLTLDVVETPVEEYVEENEVGKIGTQYDPTLDLSGYQFPSLDLLQQYGTEKVKIDTEELERNKDQIVQTLQHYNIDIQKIKATVGPTVTLYEIVPAPGVRISKIKNLEDDIALSLAALGIRIIAPIPGKGTIGIEVPNVNKETVSMRTLLASEKFQHAQMELPIALGKTISNEIFVADLAKMPHLLMAGATGQGKSVGINAILASLLYKKHPAQLKFVMIDPKKVELSIYSHIEKHFLAKLPGEEDPIIVDTKKAIHTLKALCIEMDTRY